MSISPINSYKDFCAEFIPEQYKNSEKLLGLIELALAQCDFIEKALHELLDAIDISKAEGPALDFIGALVGVERVPGQTDSSYRVRILQGSGSAGLPAPEVLRNLLKLGSKTSKVGLYPDYPAGLYAVFHGVTTANILDFFESLTSGVMMARGTFLRGEIGDNVGYIVSEDNGVPFVIDWHPMYSGYNLATEQEQNLLTEDNLNLLAE